MKGYFEAQSWTMSQWSVWVSGSGTVKHWVTHAHWLCHCYSCQNWRTCHLCTNALKVILNEFNLWLSVEYTCSVTVSCTMNWSHSLFTRKKSHGQCWTIVSRNDGSCHIRWDGATGTRTCMQSKCWCPQTSRTGAETVGNSTRVLQHIDSKYHSYYNVDLKHTTKLDLLECDWCY